MKQDNQIFTLAEIEKSRELKNSENKIQDLTDRANITIVNNQEDYNCAGNLCKEVKTLYKDIETSRKFFVNPYNLFVKKINSLFKDKTDFLDNAEKVIKNKMSAWYLEQERAAEKEQQRIARENEKKMEKFNAKVEKNPDKVYTPPVLNEAEVVIEKTSKTDTATSTLKKIPKWRLVNIYQVPREYLIINTKKMDAVVKAGVQVPGIEIYQEISLSIR